MNAQTFITRCRSIFSDNAGVRREGAKNSGPFIDEGRLSMLAVGDMRVFAKRVHRQFKDWAVHIMVDCSGSIGRDDKEYALAEAVLSISNALRDAQVGSVTVSGFNQMEQDLERFVKANDSRAFGQHLGGFYRAYHANPGGHGNHDGFFVRKAARKLAARHEAGKLLLVFSDGQPACDHAGRCAHQGCCAANEGASRGQKALGADLTAALREVKRLGVTALGVGVQSPEVVRFYGDTACAVVTDLRELFSKTAALIERHIIRG